MDFMLKQLLIVLVLLAVTPYIVGNSSGPVGKAAIAAPGGLRPCPFLPPQLGGSAQAAGHWPSGSLRPIPHCLLDAQIHPLETGGTVLRPFPAGNGQTAVCPGGV